MIEKMWIDIETTGLSPKYDTIIELAAIHSKKTFHMYCLPENKPDNFEKISDLTGITWEFLEKNGVPEKELYSKFIEYLDSIVDKYSKQDKVIFSGYGVHFDNFFVRELFEKNRNNYFGSYFVSIVFDMMTIVLDEICYRRLNPLMNYKLENVCNCYDIEFNAHSALEDIRATINLYNIIAKNKGENSWISAEEKLKNDTDQVKM